MRDWTTRALLAAAVIVAIGPACVCAAEAAAQPGWPQFHGPKRDNISTDTHLLKRWPEGGPKLLWRAKGIGQGWATVAIADGSIYTAGEIGRDTVITALDMAGTVRWRAKNGPRCSKTPRGARATPTLAAGKLYHLNGDGDVLCVDAATGKTHWTLNMLKKFGGRNIIWALSESLLVDGRKVVCCPGGQKVAMVALDKDTGETLWTCAGAGDKPAYATAILVDFAGLRQIVTLTGASAIGVAADTGKLLWRYEHKVRYEAACASPIFHEGRLAVFGTWGRGATMLRLSVRGRSCAAAEVWRTKELDNEHGGVVLVDGFLFGQSDGNHKQRHWTCLELATGKTMWSVGGLPGRSGTLTYADGMLYVMSDQRAVALVPASPKAWKIVSRFELPRGGRGMTWAHPVVCGGRLYLRHGDFLYVYDVRAAA